MIHGFTAMMLKESPVSTIGLKNVTQTQKSMASLVKCEGDVDCLFVLKVLFTMNFYLMARLSTKSTILKWSNVCERQGEEKGQFCEGRKNGCSNTTLPHIPHCLFMTFLQSMRPQSSCYHCNRQISHQQTSFLFLKLQSTLKGWRFESAENIQENSLASCVQFHKKHSSNASKTESSVLSMKETISNRTRLNNS